MPRWTWLGLVAGVPACSGGDESHACEAGTPTCESSLVVLLPDARTDFNLAVSDDVGLDLTIRCPLVADPEQPEDGIFGDYTVFCGAGRMQIDTWSYFGDQVEVQLEQTEPRQFEPRYSKGIDYCGNPCTQGTIEL